MKPPAMSPPRKDKIRNQDSTIITTQQDTILPPLLAEWPTGYKPFIYDTHSSNKIEDGQNNSTDNSRTDNEVSVNKLNFKKVKDKDYEYKEDISEAPKSDESVIKYI